ncbi:DUF885 domain-containing protein [Croceiramulus getboli]|nr:DUF885 domain-containing protein [Flavobacteriaceae bacterium YJPT1-3]
MKTTCFVSLLLLTAMASAQSASERLITLIDSVQSHEGYDREEYPMGLHTADYYEQEAAFAKAQLKDLQIISADSLSETERISKTLLRYQLQETVDYFEQNGYKMDLLSDSGFHVSFPYYVRPLATYKQVKNYLNQLNAMSERVDQSVSVYRTALKEGYGQPRVIFEGYSSTYDDQLVDDYQDSYFYQPFLKLPATLTEAQKDSVLQAAQKAMESSVLPAYRKVKQFFETEYLPKTRTSLGVSETPGGAAYYQNRIAYYTTLPLTAQEIHKTGLAEVARIKAAMREIIKEVEFEGSFEDFLKFLRTDEQFYAESPEELLRIARDMAKRADAQLPRFFKTLPRQPYGVAPVPDAIAPKYTGGRYVPAPLESTNPGYYWVNTYDLPSRTLYTLPALTVHEAVPGHHLQIALNKELGDSIPFFRQNFYLSAFGEGWGLYCEYLAAEMGMYTTPYERFGQLTYEMWRACRLVVDTGIHALGWTRQQVVDFMAENTALSIHEINTETDRYISWPGQALAYKIGELKIRELRAEAEEALGADFDIREFHEVILEQGTVTLNILEERVQNWIQKQGETQD